MLCYGVLYCICRRSNWRAKVWIFNGLTIPHSRVENGLLYLCSDEVTHTSEYAYLPAGTDSLCHTSNFQWKRNVDVHVVVSGIYTPHSFTPPHFTPSLLPRAVKNLGLWVQHLIHNMEHVSDSSLPCLWPRLFFDHTPRCTR